MQTPPIMTEAQVRQLLVQEQVRRRLLGNFRRFPPTTLVLVAAIVAVHLAVGFTDLEAGRTGLFGAFLGERSTDALLAWGARDSGRVVEGEAWRMFSALFLHGDALHLAMNMLALFGLGRLCEAIWGPVRLVWLFLVAGLAGSLLSQVGGGISVGASGAVFGLMGAGVVYGQRFKAFLPRPARDIFGRGLVPWIALNIFIGLTIPRIDNLGHLGGLVGGALLALFLDSPVIPGRDPRPVPTAAMAFTSAAILGWTSAEMVASWLESGG